MEPFGKVYKKNEETRKSEKGNISQTREPIEGRENNQEPIYPTDAINPPLTKGGGAK